MSYKDFIHLHNHTEYSMLDSICKYKDMIAKAKELNMPALAMTDHANMYATLRFYKECKEQGIKPIIGCEIYTTKDVNEKMRDNFHLILLAKNNIGYHNLIRIVSESSEHLYYKFRVDRNIIRRYSEGLICLTACRAGEIQRHLLSGEYEKAKNVAEEYIDIFGKEDFYMEVQHHDLPNDSFLCKEQFRLAEELGIKVVATNDIHYLNKEDAEVQDVIYCIKQDKKIDEKPRLQLETNEFYFKSQEEMYEVFKDYKNCLSNTKEIADKCHVEIEFKMNLTPQYPDIPDGMDETSYLRKLCEDALPFKYENERLAEAKKRLNYELDVISKMNYSGYFLIVWDFIRYARSQNISIGPGRGSGAGSIVCYLTDITRLDPLKYNLLFERFLNPDRVSMPDIDTDIADYGRNQVAEYMMKKYQYHKSAKIFTAQTMAAKSAVRNVTKVFGLPVAFGSVLANLIPTGMTIEESLKENMELREKYNTDAMVKKVLDIAIKIQDLPRQKGSHAAGIVLSEYPLKDCLPIEKDVDGWHTQFDKDEVEKIGLLKMDLLGLKNLTILDYAKKLVRENHGIDIDFFNIPLDDKKTFDMLKKGDTLGVFQLESDGITQLVKDLAPNSYADLIPLVALYRPGPLGSGMVSDFIKCSHGEKEITYLHPLLEPILKETYGVILYQEQVMQIVQTMAGFSLGEADLVRRAMGHKEPELLKQKRNDFVNGCVKNNISKKLAEEIFDLMSYFSSYGFNKSHSAAYAYLSFVTAYLKANYPLEYFSAYVSSNMANEKKLAESIRLCRNRGINFLLPNINKSEDIFKPEGKDIRYGFGAINGFGDVLIKKIISERTEKPFQGITDFLYRTNINKSNFDALAQLNAFIDFNIPQSSICACISEIYEGVKNFSTKVKRKKKKEDGSLSLFGDVTEFELTPPPVEHFISKENFPAFSLAKKLQAEKKLLGFYVSHNPLDFFKQTIEKCVNVQHMLKNPQQYHEKTVRVCGLLNNIHVITTKKGDKMAFISLEVYDEKIDCILFPKIYQQALKDNVLNQVVIFIKRGKVQYDKEKNKLQIIVNEILGKSEF